MVLAMTFGTSAFAESRHHEGTSRGSRGNINRGSSRSTSSGQSRERGVTQSQPRVERGTIQPRVQSPQRYDSRNIDRGSVDNGRINRGSTPRDGSGQTYQQQQRGTTNRDWRGNVQRGTAERGTYGRGTARGSVALPRGAEADRFHRIDGWHGGGRAPYRPHEFVRSYGRVERFERWHGGYRVWLGGLYPIFVPFDVWGRFPLRVGLYIGFGGYWDPFGYWSVNNYSPYYGDGYPQYYDGGAYTSGVVHGVVESVDYRRGTMVVNDDVSRQFVTIEMPRDRRMSDVRPGDYVELSGDWNRGGVFDAYRLERWDTGRDGDRGYRDDGRY
ncbi:MAG TPA: hypothetical protein VLU46_14580 [Thermoanaerobaculia bacterium]|nr:hypothetical protein [Thermoanaerobaculia bacterium]